MMTQPIEIVDMDQLEYNRYPIFINRHSVAVIHVWTRCDNIADVFLPELGLEFPRDEQAAARQFIQQLEDHWTPAFLMALRDAVTEALRQHDADFGTDFSEV